MTNLAEIARWEAGIYQFETSDPVQGGPDGIDNLQAKQLANRTAFLKVQQEGHAGADNPHPQYATLTAMQTAIAALVNAAPGALDTLRELADAIGDDPNFAATMTNALALKAAIDSQTFTGTPKAPTPPQFDSSKRLATTEAMRLAGMQLSGVTPFAGPLVGVVSHIGGMVYGYGIAANSYSMPDSARNSVPVGATVKLGNFGTQALMVVSQGNDKVQGPAFAAASSLLLPPGTDSSATYVGGGVWLFTGNAFNNSSADFAASMGVPGYQKLPNGQGGLFFQWGTVLVPANGVTGTITLPMAMPNGILSASLTAQTPPGPSPIGIVAASKSTLTVQCPGVNTVSSYYIVIGY
jgi:hypothetical protein